MDKINKENVNQTYRYRRVIVQKTFSLQPSLPIFPGRDNLVPGHTLNRYLRIERAKEKCIWGQHRQELKDSPALQPTKSGKGEGQRLLDLGGVFSCFQCLCRHSQKQALGMWGQTINQTNYSKIYYLRQKQKNIHTKCVFAGVFLSSPAHSVMPMDGKVLSAFPTHCFVQGPT